MNNIPFHKRPLLTQLATIWVYQTVWDGYRTQLKKDITTLPGKVGVFIAIIYSLVSLVFLSAILALIVSMPGQYLFYALGLANQNFRDVSDAYESDCRLFGANSKYVQQHYYEYIHRSHFQDYINQYKFWFYAILSYCVMIIIVKTYKYYKYAKKNNLKSGDIEWKNDFINLHHR